jgi:hypothetical protein
VTVRLGDAATGYWSLGVGFELATGRAAEMFLKPVREDGHLLQPLAYDIGIVVSLLLQHGLSLEALERSLTPARSPSLLSTAVRAALETEREVQRTDHVLAPI